MWYGEYIHTLDEKDRFILPAKFRQILKTLKKKKFYITRGLDGCLSLYAEDAWEQLKEKLGSLSFTKQQSRHFNRIFFSGASETMADKQGRMTVPDNLKEFAQIKREIVIIGVVNRIEVWDKNLWTSFYHHNKKRYEEMAEDLFVE
ncbi:MAG: division/cell wall cluster transcriptional repressor MraZ [Candidatus Omnitrophica bacterium]|nr:division/cell wall cluster transcriptional repressor MraZ [Candidatus Omnitrophota bacterium]MBU2266029.1 division/cell wall cluster transcriptional repressor MraZ [Candidatus Omnitrophota bacterium]MBU2473656.1 division/cell wall cluster transcriptional repressor MraZ [Candidatus Omnitrophota bacterium]